MIPSAAPPTLPPPLPSEEKPFLGYAIVKGRFRFLSVSQIVQADHRQEGGCLRRWAFVKVAHKKEPVPVDDPRTRGKKFAREAEMYLKYNYDALSPVMRAGKHLLPKPGPDLEVEQDLAGSPEKTMEAIALRDRVLAGEKISDDVIGAIAGLSLFGIPLIGAADYGHQRGYYITEGGVLVKEPHPDTFEDGDHKTTARIRDHVTKPRKKGGQPMTLPGYAKNPEQIGHHPQMLGYGVRTHNKHPHIKWIRSSHNYYQTKNGYSADKRMILLPVEEILARWHGEVAPVVRQMIDVAQVSDPNTVPYNLKSCKAFGKDCPHAEYCERPARSFADFAADAFGEQGGSVMNLESLFPGSGTNGATAPSTTTIPSLPPQSDEERAAQIAAEKAKLTAQSTASVVAPRHPLQGLDNYTVGQNCNGRGYYKEQRGDQCGFIGVEPGHTCPACAQAPTLPTMAGVNPADAPPVDHIASSDPLTSEAIAEITDPTLRATAEAHAKAHAERAAAEAAARAAEKPAKKPSGCTGVGQKIAMGDKEKLSRKSKCPGCGKELKIRDADIAFEGDAIFFVVPKHKLAESSTSAMAPTPPPVAPAPVAATPPALPIPAPAPAVTADMFPPAATSTLPTPPSLPPPLPAPVHVTTNTMDTALSPHPRQNHLFGTPDGRSTLFLNTVFVRGEAPKNLDEYARDLIRTLTMTAKVDDLRYVPDGHELGFGRWKGALVKMVKSNPLPPGEYVLHVHGSDARQEIAEAVADMLDARVVRGAL